MTHKTRAVTIIELVCIVAIVALLSAIAVPNLYETKTSSMVAQARMDMQSISTGLSAYKTDFAAYPHSNLAYSCLVPPTRNGEHNFKPTLERLTTPINYIKGPLPYRDPFEANGTWTLHLDAVMAPSTEEEAETLTQYFHTARDENRTVWWDEPSSPTWFLLESAGPDRRHHRMHVALSVTDNYYQAFQTLHVTLYDPTNGAISRGSIWEFGGTPEGRGSVFTEMISNANSSRVANWQEVKSK